MLETFSKVDELRKHVGEVFCDNNSSTLRSRLVRVTDGSIWNRCLIEEAPSPYNKVKPKKGYSIVNAEYVHTCFFGV